MTLRGQTRDRGTTLTVILCTFIVTAILCTFIVTALRGGASAS
jgi:hypothetical protein